MKNKLFLLIIGFGVSHFLVAQTVTNQFYQVASGQGNGIRFWGTTDNYKIHMGTSSQYLYGPVNSNSIKTNQANLPGYGWTWGINGLTPVAALNNQGVFQIKSNFVSENGSIQAKENVVSQNGEIIAQNGGIRCVTPSTIDWVYALSVWVDRDKTKAFTVNTISGINLFTIWGNGVVNAKKIYAEGIHVLPSAIGISWPDFVFYPDYDNMSLSDLEKYIFKYGHLPNVPSATEVKRNGVDLVKLNASLLQKIEELTLHIIDQEKRISELEEKQKK